MRAPLPNITPASWIMVGILGFVWGSTFMLIEVALTGATPFWLATFRLTIAAIVMAAFWGRDGFKMGSDPDNKPHPLALIWAGAVSSAIPFLLLNWGQQYVTSGFAGTSMAAVPLVVLPMAHFMVAGERLSLRAIVGVTLGFIGVFLLVGQDALHSSGADLEFWGRLACLSVAFCYALNSITIRRIPPINPTALTTIMMATGALITLPFSILAEGAPSAPPLKACLAVIFLGVVSTAAMNQLRVLVIRSAGPTFMTLVNYQVPVWSVVLGAWVLREPLPPALILALALILGGVAISQWPVIKRLFVRRQMSAPARMLHCNTTRSPHIPAMTYPVHERQGLPEEMQLLLREYPRVTWPDHPNFARSVQKWMGAHDTFRALSSYIREDSEAFLDKKMEDQIYAQKLAKYGHILLQSLHGHHTWEDRRFFPELGAAESRLITGLDMLETDHEELDGTLDDFKRVSNRVVQLAQLSPPDMYNEAGTVLRHAEDIGTILNRHLTDEEDLVVPIILHHKLHG